MGLEHYFNTKVKTFRKLPASSIRSLQYCKFATEIVRAEHDVLQAENGSTEGRSDFQKLTEEVHNRAWNLSHISWFQSKCLNHKIILQA